MKYKIFHTADIHIIIRGQHEQRKIEFQKMLERITDVAVEFMPNLNLLPGDMFEKHNANAEERALLVDFLINLQKRTNAPVIITPGNHDIMQQGFDIDPGDGRTDDKDIDLKELLTRPGFDEIHYIDETGFFDIGPVILANWSHQAKYSTKEQPYNPWTTEHTRDNNRFYIDVYHDPIRECLGWDDLQLKGHANRRLSADEFKGDLGLFGDIHRPGVYKNAQGIMVSYPSSPIICNYGEGDYYTNLKLSQNGMSRHGVNLVTIDTDTKQVEQLDFVAIQQYRGLHTINIEELPNAEAVEKFTLQNPGDINKVRINFNVVGGSAVDILQKLINRLHKQHHIVDIETSYGKYEYATSDTLSDTELDTQQLQSKEFLHQLLNDYVEQTITADKLADDVERAAVKEELLDLLQQELEKLELQQYQDKLTLQVLNIENFASIANATIPYQDFPKLLKINGNNGNGKSNIIRAMKWLATSRIDARQKQNQKKSNRLDLFNDKVDADTVKVTGKFLHNDDKLEITRQLDRTWSDETQRHSRHWKQHVSGCTETLTIKINGDVRPDSEHDDLMNRLFGDYFEFVEMHCIDQSSLDAILHKDSLELVSWILWHIGLDAFNQLGDSDRVKQVKQSLYDGMTKPGQNLESLEVEVKEAETVLHAEQKEYDNLQNRLTEAKADEHVKDLQVQQLQTKVHNFTDDDRQLLAKDITEIEKNFTEQKESQKFQEEQYQTKRQQISEIEPKVEQFTVEVANLDQDLSQYKQKYAENNHELETLRNEEQQNAQFLANLEAENKEELATLKENVNEKIDTRKEKLERIDERWTARKQELLNEQNQVIQEKIDVLQKDQRDKELLQEKLQLAIKQKEQEILTEQTALVALQESKCPACGQTIKDSTEVASKIKAKNEIIEALHTKVTTYQESSDELTKQMQAILATVEEKQASKLKIEDWPKHAEQPWSISVVNGQAEESKTLTEEIQELQEKLKVLSEYTGLLPKLQERQKQLQERQKTIAERLPVLMKVYEENRTEKIQAQLDARKQDLSIAKTNLTTAKQQMESAKELASKASQTLQSLQYQIDRYQNLKKLQIENAKYEQELLNAKSEFARIRERVANLQELQLTGNQKLEAAKTRLATAEETRKQLLLWQRKQLIENAYTFAVSKKGLMKQLFDKVSDLINARLAALLADTNFRVFFDIQDDYNLRMLDLLGTQSNRPMYMASGMEGTLPALCIVALIKSLKPRRNLNWLHIDEITGKINNGEKTEGSDQVNKDYQEITYKLVELVSEICNIAIIDHVLEDQWFPSRLQVTKSNEGCTEVANTVK